MSMTQAEFETTIGEDIDVTIIFEYCHDSDETGSFIETNLISIHLTSDKYKTDIQSLCEHIDLNLDEEGYKASQNQKENEDEDRAASRSNEY